MSDIVEDLREVAARPDCSYPATMEKAADEIERLQTAMRALEDWAGAYPLDVFPEPDFKKANEVLEAAGISLGAISASNMRHVITRVGEIARAALHPAPIQGEKHADQG